MRPIAGIQPPQRPQSPFGNQSPYGAVNKGGMPGSIGAAGGAGAATGPDSFAKLLTNEVKNVNSMQVDANDMVHTMLTGGNVNEAEVLTAVQKADLAFRMLLQVRNKLVEAYREVQQIQI
ncbi:flagellar hook-basal body protein FliE [Rubripirellula lacrimiformis]|uniref:Flagellar hook-basal body complex protein FliE n=1 Tax=Rubripirellula lacrimiformis TaxID=1930273 RepID=A0A517N6W1_9BACT|nr:flagellar hook-basal body complex protein FliE [Rubripirellula lacrimiformis]QDT02738.1 flagellar hook-basal body protein FliE [Rubripirellula lacrimiformis]